jgi:hypothetical protein
MTTALGIAGAFVATFIGQTIGWYRLDLTMLRKLNASIRTPSTADLRSIEGGHKSGAPARLFLAASGATLSDFASATACVSSRS